MKKLWLLQSFLFLFYFAEAQKQQSDSSHIISLNQQIDTYVVQQNVTALDTMYANDFVFSHGSGRVDGKERWLQSVAKNTYPVRQHDSVTADMHVDLAIVRGKMVIQRVDKDKTAKYSLKYVRVYQLRNKRWQLVTHITTEEHHDQ